jgi:hypothetical protein
MSDANTSSASAQLQPDQPHYDPTDWTPVIEQAFFVRLSQLVERGDATAWPQPVDELVRQRLAAVEAKARPVVANAMDAANLRFTALAVAAYEVLEPVCGSTRAATMVEDCLNSPLREDILTGARGMLDQADDPFTALVAVSKEREKSYFGPSFRFERPVDDDDTYVLDVRRCLFHEVLVAAGRPELQPILCRFDLNWVDAIQPARHHLRFVRPVTFASDTTCRMLFTREEHLPEPVVEPARASSARQETAGQ